MRLVNLTLRVPYDVAQAIEARAEVTGKSKAQVVIARLVHTAEPPFSPSPAPPASRQPRSSVLAAASRQATGLSSRLDRAREQRLRVRQLSAQICSNSCQLVAQSKQLVVQTKTLVTQSKQRFHPLETRSDQADHATGSQELSQGNLQSG